MTDFLNNPQFLQALEQVRARAYEEWLNTTPDQTVERERLWFRVHAFEEIRAELHSDVDSATFATQEQRANDFRSKLR